MVSEKDEKYRYSRNRVSGGTVSVICTSADAGQKTKSKGYLCSDSESCSPVKNEFASGVKPKERIGIRVVSPHARQAPALIERPQRNCGTKRWCARVLRLA